VERAPDDRAACFNLGIRNILSGGDYAAAESLFTGCVTLKSESGMPSEAMVRWCLGLAYHLQGKDTQAEAEWQAVYEIDKDFDCVLEDVPDMAELKAILEADLTD
jgi:hypothetical protein